tara:strand:+ start:258 stop:1088 length:831 start_codon:yes stop_codon:yes gene_type:complete
MEPLNILITGRTGFLGRELESKLKDKYNILQIDRFDLTDPNTVSKIFNTNNIDVVIHTAAKGGKRTKQDSIEDLTDNLSMFQNLINNSNKYKVLFNFCSGAAFNKKEEINNISEDSLSSRYPYDYYGMSKNLIARECSKHDNVFNFRLFGCFGKNETPDRFFSQLKIKYEKGMSHIIHQNIEMDFFSSTDVANVIMHYLENYTQNNLPQDINLVYPEKYNLHQLTDKFFNSVGCVTPVTIERVDGLSYTGDGTLLKSLGLELEGLELGLREVYKNG